MTSRSSVVLSGAKDLLGRRLARKESADARASSAVPCASTAQRVLRCAQDDSARRGEAGFTLIELLIAMTLLGMLTVMLAAGLRTGARVWERGEVHATGMDDVRLAQSLLRRLLAAAYPLLGASTGERRPVVFEGKPTALVFLGPAPVALAPGGRARIALEGVATETRLDLVMAIRPELDHRQPGDDSQPEILLRAVTGVAFRYYGSAGPDEAPQWRERWLAPLALPRLIQVHVSFPSGDARRWPDLVISPRIYADVSCVYDPLTHRCRGR